jgi:phosphate butyryltransferase
MPNRVNISERIQEIQRELVDAGYFHPAAIQNGPGPGAAEVPVITGMDEILKKARETRTDLRNLAAFLKDRVLAKIRDLEHMAREPEDFDALWPFLEHLLEAAAGFRDEKELVPCYAQILSSYILTLYRMGTPGRESTIIRMMLRSIARRKAIEFDRPRLKTSLEKIEKTITVALIAKRYAVYVLATRGLDVVFRGEIDFRTYGTSPEALALQVTNILQKSGVKLSEVTDLVCGGGDLGHLPDGIYVLTEAVRDESWKRLHNSTLNRGALVTWELRELLRRQGDHNRVNASLCSPLSFTSLNSHDISTLFREDSREIRQSLRGFVKATPLKAMAALLSEIERINQESLNLLVMALDELFASVVRKIGPRMERELAAQDANKVLIEFDFGKIVGWLQKEGFAIPSHFRLASREIGTGVKEICELILIAKSGKISDRLARNLMLVVDRYAREVASLLERACAGEPSERPHFIVITSMMALDPNFQQLFAKIRARVDSPFTPIMCLDSLEHEYLIANHLFELYVNPAKGDRRLHFTVEAKSMRQAFQVLGTTGVGFQGFSFSTLLDEVVGSIVNGTFKPANLVLVGADNEDALVAVSNARDQGLLDKIALIGNPAEILNVVEHARVPLSPHLEPKVEIYDIDPLAVDFEEKKKSMAEVFRTFLTEHPDYVVMKGSVDTAGLLREALAMYRWEGEPDDSDERPRKKLASHTALFVLPDGRFLALSDAAVNPGFRNSAALLQVIENQLDVVRKVVYRDQVLKVAIITAVEKETSAIPATLLAGEVEERSKSLEDRYGPLIVEGPLSFDLATAPDVAEEKHYQGRIMGDANCLVATDINTANVLYKMLSKTMGSLGLLVENGGIITAGPGTVPIVLTSRGDTSQTKFNSILLALAYASRAQANAMTEERPARTAGAR